MNIEAGEKIRAMLAKIGVPTKTVEQYGSQLVITCWSEPMARRAAHIVSLATWKLRGVTRSIDYAKENTNTGMNPSKIDVWRVFACL